VIYMIQAGENGPVKIGVTDNLESRLCKMQVDNAAPLKVLRLLAGGFAQEAELHIRLSKMARVSAHLIRPDIYTPSDSAAFEAAA
jgi:hypothetical protein